MNGKLNGPKMSGAVKPELRREWGLLCVKLTSLKMMVFTDSLWLLRFCAGSHHQKDVVSRKSVDFAEDGDQRAGGTERF